MAKRYSFLITSDYAPDFVKIEPNVAIFRDAMDIKHNLTMVFNKIDSILKHNSDPNHLEQMNHNDIRNNIIHCKGKNIGLGFFMPTYYWKM
jgi:hypothetical protein